MNRLNIWFQGIKNSIFPLKTPLIFLGFMLVTIFVSYLLSSYASSHFKGDKKRISFIFISLSALYCAILLYFFGCAVSTLKGILLFLILLYASYSDIKTREADDFLSVMILLTAFIGVDLKHIPFMILSSLIITIPLILMIIICKGKTIGGADFKIITATTFLLGLYKGTLGLIIGLTLGILMSLIIYRKKDMDNGFPLVPYLAVGFLIVYLF